MMVFNALVWLVMELVKMILKVGIIGIIIIVTSVFVGGFVAFVCKDYSEGSECDETEKQVPQPQSHA
jgi:hypothetical protein